MAVITYNMTTLPSRKKGFGVGLAVPLAPPSLTHARTDVLAFYTQQGKATIVYPSGVLKVPPMGNGIISPSTGRVS